VIYVSFLLKNKHKKGNAILGILTASNYIIVNLAAWCLFSAKKDPYQGSIIWILINMFEHFVFFIFCTFLWLATLSRKYRVTYYDAVYRRNLFPFVFISITAFTILQLLTNFLPLIYKDGEHGWGWYYFSAYFQITN